MNIDFSVLISLYYKESPEYFEQCMQSLWYDQFLKPNEIVLVKDGSLPPKLEEAIYKWQSILNNVLVIVPLQENVGLGKALNAGLSHCSNEWVFRMDTDDISLPDRFEKQVTFIQKNPEIDIFSAQIIEFEHDIKNLIGAKLVPLNHAEILKYSRWRSPFNHMAIAYKKSVIEKVGGYRHHAFMEDYNLWLRVLAAGFTSANLPDTLLYVRAGKSMIERRRGWGYVKSEWQLFKLKQNLHYQPIFPAFWSFFIRSVPRLLPSKFLVKIYSFMRST